MYRAVVACAFRMGMKCCGPCGHGGFRAGLHETTNQIPPAVSGNQTAAQLTRGITPIFMTCAEANAFLSCKKTF